MALIDNLKIWALRIKNQTEIKGNTQTLVGGLFEAIVAYLKDLSASVITVVDSLRKELLTKIEALSVGVIVRPSVPTYAQLPKNPVIGWDVLVEDQNLRYRWNGEQWIAMGTGSYDNDFAKKVNDKGEKVVYALDGIIEIISENSLNSPSGDGQPIGVGDNLIEGYNSYVRGRFVNSGTGAIEANAVWNVTDYIYMKGVTALKAQLVYANGGAFYNENKSFISGYGVGSGSVSDFPITPPANAFFIRHNVRENVIDNYQLIITAGSTTGSSENVDLLLNNLKFTAKQITQIEGIAGSATNSRQIRHTSIGDSIPAQDGKPYTQGANIGKIAIGFQSILKQTYTGMINTNRAVGGQTMTGSNDSTYTLGVSLNYANIDLVTISSATNDFRLNKVLGAILSTLDTTPRNVNTYIGALQALIEYIISSNPATKIVLLTPIQRHNPPNTVDLVNTQGHRLIDYADAVIAVGALYGIQVIDMYRKSNINPLNRLTFLTDGVHPNDAGYSLMGNLLIKEIIL